MIGKNAITPDVGSDGKLSHGPYCLRGDWYCIVEGRSFGPWPDKGSCQAGYKTEQRRAQRTI